MVSKTDETDEISVSNVFGLFDYVLLLHDLDKFIDDSDSTNDNNSKNNDNDERVDFFVCLL